MEDNKDKKVEKSDVSEALAKLGVNIQKADTTTEDKKDEEIQKGSVEEQLASLSNTVEDLKKSYEDVLEKANEGEDITKATLTAFSDSLSENLGEKFQALGNIQKSVIDMVEGVAGTIDSIVKAVETVSETVEFVKADIEKIGDAPLQQKSYLGVGAVEKSFKNDMEKSHGLKEGEKVVSATRDRKVILKAFDELAGDIEKSESGGHFDATMNEHAITYETSGIIADDALTALREKKGLVVVA